MFWHRKKKGGAKQPAQDIRTKKKEKEQKIDKEVDASVKKDPAKTPKKDKPKAIKTMVNGTPVNIKVLSGKALREARVKEAAKESSGKLSWHNILYAGLTLLWSFIFGTDAIQYMEAKGAASWLWGFFEILAILMLVDTVQTFHVYWIAGLDKIRSRKYNN